MLWIGTVSTVVLAIPAFLLLSIGTIPAILTGLAMIAFPVTFFVANLASALPALFPTAHRYAAMGIAYNFAVAIFGGTAPFVIAALIQATGNDMMPAYKPDGNLGDCCRHHLLHAGIRAAEPARDDAQRGIGGSGPRTRGDAGREPSAGNGHAAVR